jgi:hypothetical protein
MASASLTVDTSQVSALSKTLAAFMGQYEWIAARAMTEGVKAAKAGIARDIFPNIKGGPTTWTRRGLIARYARKDDLRAMAGFQYGNGNWSDSAFSRKGGGTPAGRYMGVNASGGDRRPKASELRLRRAGLIGSNQFITPNAKGVRLNAQGNASGAEYTRMLTRIRAMQAEGSSQDSPRGPGSRGRSAAKRKQSDYFLMRYEGGRPSRWQLGAKPAFIAKRVGRGGRGFVPAFWITDQPNYERRFNIQSIAMREFSRVFPKEFEAGVMRELQRRAK